MSRIGGKRFLLDDDEKAVLLKMIRAAAEFSGVELYTYAIMTNHFHLLVRVPKAKMVTDKELEDRVIALYGNSRAEKVFKKWAIWEENDMNARVEEEKCRLRKRMYDISQFCKTFKEAYTQDYNRRTGNTGTIWEGRFKSNLIEPSGRALLAVSAYIHLNPVRAGVVRRPEESNWTGYGAACSGRIAPRFGLCDLANQICKGRKISWKEVKVGFEEIHEGRLSHLGLQKTNDSSQSDMRELLMRRMAGFIQGVALGSESFIEGIANKLPVRIHKRTPGIFDSRPWLGFSSALGVRDQVWSANSEKRSRSV